MFSTIRVNFAVGCGLGILAACGPGQPTPAAASLHDQAAPVWHRLVQCARQNGMPDLPDPTIDDRGEAHFPDGTPKPPDTVQQACMAIYDQLPAQVRSSTGGATPNVAQLRQFAQCMRQHGITDWPDPDANGNFPMPPSLADNIKTGPRWPQISAAWNGPCARYNPAGHVSVAPQ